MKSLLIAFALCLALVAIAPQGQAATSDIEIFVTDWCPYCRKATSFLGGKGKAFKEYNVERDESAAKRFLKQNPRGGVPFAQICGEQVLGFSPEAYEQALSKCP
jgi:glutaredoxin